jgi:drug/metabolite transporter (DMT)-like permease
VHPRTPLLTLFALVAFAANSLLCRAAIAHGAITPLAFTAWRLGAGALVLAGLVWSRRRPFPRPDALGALALLAYAAPFALAYVSLGAGTGALLLFGAVQLTMIGVGLARGERPRPAEWAGLLLALLGLFALVRPGITAPAPWAAALMLAAGVAWGVYSLRGRSAPDPLGRTAANFALAAPVALVLPLFAHGPARATGNGLGGVGLAVLSGALASGLGYVGWYAALPGLTRARAGIVQLAVPALAALGGVAFLGERPTVRLVASAALILGGVGLAVLAHATPTRRNAA